MTTLETVVLARRSVRRFLDRPLDRSTVERAAGLAATAPAPHHSAPWRFTAIDSGEGKLALAEAMGDAWRADLTRDGVAQERIDRVLQRSRRLLTSAAVVVVASVDLSGRHTYPDERRALAEWSLFAHSVGASLQTFMLALAAEGVASCWLSAPAFCPDVVRAHLRLDPVLHPAALVLVGYADPDNAPSPRVMPDGTRYLGWL